MYTTLPTLPPPPHNTPLLQQQNTWLVRMRIYFFRVELEDSAKKHSHQQ